MITKIGEIDRFGYDDAGRPIVTLLANDLAVWGYCFCARFKEALAAGIQDLFVLYRERNDALIALFSPTTKNAELWAGQWSYADSIYTIRDPSYAGLLN